MTKVKSVVTLNNGVEVSFVDQDSLKAFLLKVPVAWQVKCQLTTEILVTLSPRVGEGHSLVSDEALWAALSRYGEIKKGRRMFFQEFPDIENGVRQFVVIPKSGSTIPSSMSFGRAVFKVAYRGQAKICHRCNSKEHEIRDCTAEYCYRCHSTGHMKANCKQELFCNVCSEQGHLYNRCPKSWALKVKLQKGWSGVETSSESRAVINYDDREERGKDAQSAASKPGEQVRENKIESREQSVSSGLEDRSGEDTMGTEEPFDIEN